MLEVPMPIDFDDRVHDVITDWPCFHTVGDTCGEHHVGRDVFLKALREGAAKVSRD
jgi:hypothetical protein